MTANLGQTKTRTFRLVQDCVHVDYLCATAPSLPCPVFELVKTVGNEEARHVLKLETLIAFLVSQVKNVFVWDVRSVVVRN